MASLSPLMCGTFTKVTTSRCEADCEILAYQRVRKLRAKRPLWASSGNDGASARGLLTLAFSPEAPKTSASPPLSRKF
jgi:hypothetical protein